MDSQELLPPRPHPFPDAGSSEWEVDSVTDENKKLKERVLYLEDENDQLKKAYFDLSRKLTEAQAMGLTVKPFDVTGVHSYSWLDGNNVTPGSEAAEMMDRSKALQNAEELSAISSVKASQEQRKFTNTFQLSNHNGAVHCARFSPCGKLLASGSIDKTVRIWDMASSESKQLHSFSGIHDNLVSEVDWSSNSALLLSCSFDHSVALYDMERRTHISSFVAKSYLLSAQFNPTVDEAADRAMFFATDALCNIIMFDSRTQKPAMQFKNDYVIWTLYVELDGQFIVTGDQKGRVRVWDVRKSGGVNNSAAPAATVGRRPTGLQPEGAGPSFWSEQLAYPTSPAVMPPGAEHGTNSSSVASNSNAIPNLDLTAPPAGSNSSEQLPTGVVLSQQCGGGETISHLHAANLTDAAGNTKGSVLAVNSMDNVLRVFDRGPFSHNTVKPGTTYRIRHELHGHKNRHWPIHSSFFCGKDRVMFGKSATGHQDDDASSPLTIDTSLMLATGSADSVVYLYDVSNPDLQEGQLLQKLEGHTDVVYGVQFHPTAPILVSYSADQTLRVWAAKSHTWKPRGKG